MNSNQNYQCNDVYMAEDNYAKPSGQNPQPMYVEAATVETQSQPPPQADYYFEGVAYDLSPTLYAQARLQFVRKVYAILSIQLLITVALTVASMYSEDFMNFQLRNSWIMWVSIALIVISEIIILCLPFGRRSPYSYIFLSIFTLAFSYIISCVCSLVASQQGKFAVLTAAIMTFGVVAAATMYAMVTRTDFTTKWGIVIVVLFAMIFLALFSIFYNGPFLNNLYCTLGVILFGIYLIIDTQMIVGGKRMQFTIDNYVPAAMLLYLDIVQIFLYFMSMMRR